MHTSIKHKISPKIPEAVGVGSIVPGCVVDAVVPELGVGVDVGVLEMVLRGAVVAVDTGGG